MRFLATMLFSAALALPAMAQPDRGRPGEGPNPQAEIEKLKQLVRELEAKLQKGKAPDAKKEEPRKPEPKKEEFKKPEPRKEGGPPMGFQRGRGGEGGPMGGFRGPMGGPPMMGGGMNFPGMNNLTPEEQATFRKLVAKMSAPPRSPESKQPERKPEGKPSEGKPGSKSSPSLEERLDRLEKMVQELVRSQRSR